MKILIHTYDTAYQNKAGGVRNRIDHIVCALRALGVDVEFFNKYNTCIADFDILHIFKLDANAKPLIDYAVSMGVKVVVSSIMTLEKGWVVDFYWGIRHLPFATLYKQVFGICEKADGLIVETPKEAEFMKRYYRVEDNVISVIPNGADLVSGHTELIFDILKSREEYAVIAARFDENKNQLKVIQALKNADVKIVFAGGPDVTSRDYYDQCLREAENVENFYFLGWIEHDDPLFRSLLANAKVIACPSYHETFGLSIIEGIMAGAVPVISRTLPILDFPLFQNCLTFNPRDCNDIRRQIKKAMHMERDDKWFHRMQRYFSWESVAEQHIKFYEAILEKGV